MSMLNENITKSKGKIPKWLLILGGIIVLIIVIAIAGGGGEKNEAPTSTSEETPTVYSINQDVRVGDIGWKLIDVKDYGNILKGSKSKYPDWYEDKITTGKFIGITLEVENLGTEVKSMTSYEIIDDRGRKFRPASDVLAWIPEEKELILFPTLNPNITKQFTEIYEVSADATGLKIKVGDLTLLSPKEALISLGL